MVEDQVALVEAVAVPANWTGPQPYCSRSFSVTGALAGFGVVAFLSVLMVSLLLLLQATRAGSEKAGAFQVLMAGTPR